ncbi:hypothetical protein B0H16DRAFT_1461275 [Mycena metata]|uniref:Uncharacterized protein n=1 Tax=Mycena metata TaxID=1033252 RepID=A0AAD7IUL3_9AGAR|nr:hypothetical protein B0H16DRAFT_1461275 [Mycena metata]
MVPGLTAVLFNSIPVKIEPPNLSPISIKPEPQATSLPGPGVAKGVQLRTLIEGGHEVFELLSESEPEPDSEVEVGTPPIRSSSRASSITMYTDTDDFNLGGQSGMDDFRDGASGHWLMLMIVMQMSIPSSNTVWTDDSDKDDPRPSDTLWQNNITSAVRTGRFTITQKIKVQRLEHLSAIPSIWPIPRTSTAFVIDLNDDNTILSTRTLGTSWRLIVSSKMRTMMLGSQPQGPVETSQGLCREALDRETGPEDGKRKQVVVISMFLAPPQVPPAQLTSDPDVERGSCLNAPRSRSYSPGGTLTASQFRECPAALSIDASAIRSSASAICKSCSEGIYSPSN